MVGKDFPSSFEGWEKLARAHLDEERFRYISAGAGYDETTNANLEAFKKWKIVPRVFRDVEKRNKNVALFGTTSSAPILLAPVRALGYIHRNGDLEVAKVAAALGIPFVVSTFATTPIERIAEVMGSATRWFQLYPGMDKEITHSLVRRAEASGYSAIVVTIDKAHNYPQYGGPTAHEYDKYGYEVYFSDPVFKARFDGAPEKQLEAARKLWREVRMAHGFSLDDLRLLITQTKLPVILKGVLHPKDAELAIENGASGIIVSNHGGRSLDGEIASLDALVEIRKVIDKGFPVLLDGGVRSGTDVVKSLALGANAVMIGRAYLWGLGAAGEVGVRRVIGNLIKEFDSAMGICGAVTVGDFDRFMLERT